MCLTIDKTKHTEKMRYGNFKKLPKPFIADKDIVCYKMLTKYRHNGVIKYETPYRYVPIKFENGVSSIETNIFNRKYLFTYGYNEWSHDHCVYNGVHGYIEKPDFLYEDRKIFTAIIPKGSMYYLGEDNDIVAYKMIIFENIKAFYKYKKNNIVTYINNE